MLTILKNEYSQKNADTYASYDCKKKITAKKKMKNEYSQKNADIYASYDCKSTEHCTYPHKFRYQFSLGTSLV